MGRRRAPTREQVDRDDELWNEQRARRAERHNAKVRDEQDERDTEAALQAFQDAGAPLEARAIADERGLKLPKLKSTRR